MSRRFVLGVASSLGLLAACPARRPTSGEPAKPVPAAPLARPLAGPFATIDAFCETQPRGDDRECRAVDGIAAEGNVEAPFRELAVVYVTGQPPVVGCAIALRIDTGWFVASPSADACRDPSYIAVDHIHIDREGSAFVIALDITWHTKASKTGEGDDQASYVLTTFCGMSSGKPACVPTFPTKCEPHAPVDGCADGFEVTWKVADGNLTTTATTSNALVPAGTRRLF